MLKKLEFILLKKNESINVEPFQLAAQSYSK